jgi:hypothetical protein
MSQKSKFDKDADPQTGAVGAGAVEYRETGPLDPAYDPEKETEARLQKQRDQVTLRRAAPGQAVATWAERK